MESLTGGLLLVAFLALCRVEAPTDTNKSIGEDD